MDKSRWTNYTRHHSTSWVSKINCPLLNLYEKFQKLLRIVSNFIIFVSFISQRRIGTRGSDKGVKEEIKQAIRRQISRSNEAMDELIIKFLTQERGHILQTLM